MHDARLTMFRVIALGRILVSVASAIPHNRTLRKRDQECTANLGSPVHNDCEAALAQMPESPDYVTFGAPGTGAVNEGVFFYSSGKLLILRKRIDHAPFDRSMKHMEASVFSACTLT